MQAIPSRPPARAAAAAGFQLNQELANADTAEQEAKRILAAKMADYHAARDAYAEAADNLKKVNAKFGI